MFSSSVWHMISIQYMMVVLLLLLVKMLLSFLYSAEGRMETGSPEGRAGQNTLQVHQALSIRRAAKLTPVQHWHN